MIAADTSIAVAAALEWHDYHALAKAAVAGATVWLTAGSAMESYSVLTRLPGERRVSAPDARQFLRRAFAGPPIALSPEALDDFLDLAARHDIVGGRIYDAVIAATAAQAGAALLTCDHRAIPTYALLGVQYQLLP